MYEYSGMQILEIDVKELAGRACPVCGHEFFPTSVWVYKITVNGHRRYVCRYNCMIAYEKEQERKRKEKGGREGEKMDYTLKPCRKCHTAWLYEFSHHDNDHANGYKVNCLCGEAWAMSRWQPTEDEAIKDWNGDDIYTLAIRRRGSDFKPIFDGTLEQCGSFGADFANDGYEIRITKAG